MSLARSLTRSRSVSLFLLGLNCLLNAEGAFPAPQPDCRLVTLLSPLACCGRSLAAMLPYLPPLGGGSFPVFRKGWVPLPSASPPLFFESSRVGRGFPSSPSLPLALGTIPRTPWTSREGSVENAVPLCDVSRHGECVERWADFSLFGPRKRTGREHCVSGMRAAEGLVT